METVNHIDKTAEDKHIYPLTIIADRYGGCYSDGAFTAWRMDPWDIPDEVFGEDIECMYFWRGKANNYSIGRGDTPQEAFDDLYQKIYGQ